LTQYEEMKEKFVKVEEEMEGMKDEIEK